jgi:hypothetical protein
MIQDEGFRIHVLSAVTLAAAQTLCRDRSPLSYHNRPPRPSDSPGLDYVRMIDFSRAIFSFDASDV